MNANISADLELALRLANLADEISTDRFLANDLQVERKPDLTPVSDADRLIEQEIRRIISVERGEDVVIGEEFGGGEVGKNGRAWVIDPIDGTKNFVRGVPVWASLISLMVGESVLLGVVSAPALFRRWYAEEKFGSYLVVNGGTPRKLTVSPVKRITDASMSISSFAAPNSGGRNDGWGDKHSKLLNLANQVSRTRAYGDFWSHMMVAEGIVDFALEPTLALWDMAALAVIVTEAGGKFTDFRGLDGPLGRSGISSNGLLHDSILALLA